jgi:hypothetical protein
MYLISLAFLQYLDTQQKARNDTIARTGRGLPGGKSTDPLRSVHDNLQVAGRERHHGGRSTA